MSTTDRAQRTWNNGGPLKGPSGQGLLHRRGLAVPETETCGS